MEQGPQGGALPTLRISCPKTAFFGPKRPRNPVKTAKPRPTVRTIHLRLDCPVTKSPLLPLTPRYVRETAQKWLKVAWMCAVCVKQAQNQQQAVSPATWLKTEFREHLVPATAYFLWFPSLRFAQRHA